MSRNSPEYMREYFRQNPKWRSYRTEWERRKRDGLRSKNCKQCSEPLKKQPNGRWGIGGFCNKDCSWLWRFLNGTNTRDADYHRRWRTKKKLIKAS